MRERKHILSLAVHQAPADSESWLNIGAIWGDPNGRINGNVGDRAFQAESSTVWVCAGGSVWNVDRGAPGGSATYAIVGPISAGSYSVAAGDEILLGDATAGPVVFSLPAAGLVSGQPVWVKKTDGSSNPVVAQAAGSETVDGDSSLSLVHRNQAVVIISDGHNWWVL